ncbi:hypothetical protein [Microbacter margulisiae]|uniref:Carbohydrate-binding module 48 (Isoamylase N-terminal domain) n=1 Tax=Microbacter margulisiae TaxID=1350067 RepID=A0A7W5DPT6_9PORP|nr:hypothetical protein [Microbacter margulisiae]MBB3186854.1 hypothetical protein [Microbacter margulisiae]
MKVSCKKEDTYWKVVFKSDVFDASGMSVVGNFNDWNIKGASTFSKNSKQLTIKIPAEFNELSFKFYDSIYDCWCEIYDNGELYSGLEKYFLRNEVGTTNVVIPLQETKEPKKPLKKTISVDSVKPKTTRQKKVSDN